jgi:hypothetical protein
MTRPPMRRTYSAPFLRGLTTAILLLPALLAAGCTTQRQWTKRGLTQPEFDRDAAACRKEAAKATYQDPFAFAAGQDQGLENTVARERRFEQCLEAKGYRLENSASGR